jgi:hypothetical protein
MPRKKKAAARACAQQSENGGRFAKSRREVDLQNPHHGLRSNGDRSEMLVTCDTREGQAKEVESSQTGDGCEEEIDNVEERSSNDGERWQEKGKDIAEDEDSELSEDGSDMGGDGNAKAAMVTLYAVFHAPGGHPPVTEVKKSKVCVQRVLTFRTD